MSASEASSGLVKLSRGISPPYERVADAIGVAVALTRGRGDGQMLRVTCARCP